MLKELNTNYEVDLHTCLTVQVENLHAMGHFKDQFPTCLQYARNLANTVYESIKRVVRWAAYYFTHEKSYYPVIPQMTPQAYSGTQSRPKSPKVAQSRSKSP